MSFLRSLFISIPLIVLATIVFGFVSLCAAVVDRSGETSHRIARVWAKVLLAVSFIRVSATGAEKLDPRGGYVFVANHASYMDIPALLLVLPQQFRFFAKRGLYRIPFLGWHLRLAGHLPVDRSNARNSLKSMTAGARAIEARRISMLLFPEGGRQREGLQAFREGAAYIAIKAGVPLVPVGIIGMRELLPMGSIHIRGGTVRIRVGQPISTEGLQPAARAEVTERLYREMRSLTEES
ncbi:MAG TPA: lysophospholipid acyltransferase family protein [Bryobacteraceae bacterium]|nr:lysophospholipid acyltransferase family protein [Bryobacteraceae bacterium]